MTKTFDLEAELDRYRKSLPLDPALIAATLREQGRHTMADLVEGMTDYIAELETKLKKAVKNRKPRGTNGKRKT